MITLIIIGGIFLVMTIGFIDVYRRLSRTKSEIEFAREYRSKFIEFANKYFQDYNRYNRTGEFDGELYVWLTMNVNKIQNNVGNFGIMSYKPAYQNHYISNYAIILNTIPKFRAGQIENFDVTSVDDCLLRYLGLTQDYKKDTEKNIKNPIIWFREGIKTILSIPIFILSWFGLLSHRTFDNILDSAIYKILTGIVALVTFTSGLVTIIVGYDQTIVFINRLLQK